MLTDAGLSVRQEGAQQLLRARSIDVVEFEYIARGFWRKDHVDQVLSQRVEWVGYPPHAGWQAVAQGSDAMRSEVRLRTWDSRFSKH